MSRIVTPEQLAEGYSHISDDSRPIVYQRKYRVIRKLPDGNWEVEEPNSIHCWFDEVISQYSMFVEPVAAING